MGPRKGAYAPEFRQLMAELVRAGRKPSELAKEFGCHDTSISAWVRQANADELGGARHRAALIDQTAMVLSHVKFNELLLEVDEWTEFTNHVFTLMHLRPLRAAHPRPR